MNPLPFFPPELAGKVSDEIKAAKKLFSRQEPEVMEWETRTAGALTVQIKGISTSKLIDALSVLALEILKVYCGACRSVCKSDQEFLNALPAIRKITFMEVFPSQDRDSTEPALIRISNPVRAVIDAQITLLKETVEAGLLPPLNPLATYESSLRTAPAAAGQAEQTPVEIGGAIGAGIGKVKSLLGRNIDRLRKECGWSFDDLAKVTDLDKKLILGHVNDGKGAHPKTLARYAQTFTEKMGRPVTVAELEG